MFRSFKCKKIYSGSTRSIKFKTLDKITIKKHILPNNYTIIIIKDTVEFGYNSKKITVYN